jgi:hypothetical protein
MPIAFANAIALIAAAYLMVGFVFALFFVRRGASVIDPAAAPAGVGFRLIILPASALLWPWLARKWSLGDAGLPPLAQARSLRRRHLPMWFVIGPLSLLGLVLALVARAAEAGVGTGPGGAP